MTTLYKSLLDLTGMPQRDAAAFHEVSIDTIKSWSSNRNRPPAFQILKIQTLISTIEKAADFVGKTIINRANFQPVTLSYCTDDEQAVNLGIGMPFKSCHDRYLSLVIHHLIDAGYDPLRIQLLPYRGSTVPAQLPTIH